MKKRNLLTIGLSLLLSATTVPLSAQVVSNDNEDEVYKVDQRMARMDFCEGEVLVKFKPGSSVQVKHRANGKFMSSGMNRVDALLSQLGTEKMEELMPRTGARMSQRRVKSLAGTEVKDHDLGKLYRVKFDASGSQSVVEAIDQLKALPEVEYAEPNYKVYVLADADDYTLEPLFSQLWGMAAINMPALWSVPTITDKRPVIAILDTGIDITHPDLADNIWTNEKEADGEEGYDNDNNGFKNDLHGWDFINQTGNIRDFNGHGTHCAGIAAAVGNNRIGVTGANPDALIMPITVMQSDGTGDLATIIKGIDYAVANGADILSMSIGTYATSAAFKEALGKAYQTAILVAAAGNDGLCLNHAHPDRGQLSPMPMFPAAYNFVLGVQASASSGAMAGFSNYDDDGAFFSAYGEDELYNYELRAPGASILSTWMNGNYRMLNGTSMACPLVAGALSRLIQCKEVDSKEELFGDLIHSKTLRGDLDIYKAFQMSDANRQPALSFVTYTIDDSEGDGDGTPDAGETIAIYPTLRNGWGQASNIRVSIELGEFEDPEIVEFLDNDVAFGSELSSYAKNKATTPLRLKISDTCADNRHIKLVLKTTCDNIATDIEHPFVIVVKNATKFSGMITQDTTLEGNKTYYVDNDILVSGCTLTIEPGAHLEFAYRKTLKIGDGAHLNAHGTPENLIIFSGQEGFYAGFTIDCPTISQQFLWANEDKTKLSYYQSSEFPNKIVFNWSSPYYQSEKYSFPKDIICCDLSTISLLQDDSHPYSSYATFYLPSDTIGYCLLENGTVSNGLYLKDCIVKEKGNENVAGERVNFQGIDISSWNIWNVYYSNIINFSTGNSMPSEARYIRDNNFFNNNSGKYWLDVHIGGNGASQPTGSVIGLYRPSYFGTSREELLRPYVREFGNTDGVYNILDLSNMRTEPVREAHGIVWKVVVNGKDAHDEYEELAPLGVGKHKFEVYFNRPMNKEVTPNITFGVRDPYTQNAVNEEGSWNEEGTIYTAYKTITGKTKSDGVNRIYVWGAEDDEFFEIPYEKARFNINVQAAGSMATGFSAEAGLGRVSLTWNNENNDIEDAMGYNLYRYTISGEGDDAVADTIRVNENIIDVEDENYVDYDVLPGQTYYYFYRTLSTDLQEYDVSNVVAVTPLTSTKGDANGSGDVDVADVITTVNYAAGQQPKPFIFEAADMNDDLSIDILDVIGIIKKILNPDDNGAKASVAATATYTVEDGVVYVDCPVELAGVQVQLAFGADEGLKMKDDGVRVADGMKGFEHTSAWLSDNDYLFLGYNMNGKTLAPGRNAILIIGDARLADIRLSDRDGRNVMAESTTVDKIDRLGSEVMTVSGIYDLQGRKLTGNADELTKLPKGVYIVNGQKVVR